MRSLRQKLSVGVTLLAWFFASGSQWDVVQVFAWGRMFAENAAAMPWTDALVRTFSPEARCEFCNAVSTAKKQQSETPTNPGSKLEIRAILVFEPVPTHYFASLDPREWLTPRRTVASAERARPPVPPPRA